MNPVKNRLWDGLSILLGSALVFASLSGCTGILNGKFFKERAAETPAPDDYGIDKSFFVDPSGKPKTFLCAWAPEVAKGWTAVDPFVNEASHCNVEFEITENFLVAKQINPSFLNDRDRWTEMLRIPITKHYYYERNKDQYGRETNEWIENANRSHWSARPKMKLNLAGIQITNLTSSEGSWGWKTTSVQDIEWDMKNNFLGFSLNAQFHMPEAGDVGLDARYRFNFLKFEHDPTFKRVPYNQENARWMNVLHVMGKFVDGVEPQLYAAHWDLRQQTTIYLSGFPKEQEQAGIAAVNKWNTEFQKIGAVPQGFTPFKPVIKNLDHPFDLRYPSITWISDRRISQSAPLGIGMAHADVRNGKILWGGIVLFGGMIEQYINAYAPIETTAPASSADKISPYAALVSMLPTSLPPADLTGLTRTQAPDDVLVEKKKKTPLTQGEQKINMQDPHVAMFAANVTHAMNQQTASAAQYFKNSSLLDKIGLNAGMHPPAAAKLADQEGRKRLSMALNEKDLDKRRQLIASLNANSTPFFIENELTIENKVGSWMNSAARTSRSFPDIMDSVVASLVIHEFGHVIGLGHQFKENIVPEEGTVPSKFVKELAAKATPEKEFTNMTSVMGYQSGRTEMMTPASEYVPGPQDDLVLRYIYKGEYATYDKMKDEFAYFQVPESGKIPEYTQTRDGKIVRASYFPQCNDYEASLGADPFCNRFDRGSSAVDIVNSYFELISDNLLASMYSLVGASGFPETAENRLWGRGFTTFGRVRLFYDEMRRRLRSEPHLVQPWNSLRNDFDGLFEFSTACQLADPTSAQVKSAALREIFKDKSIVDLCRANALALKEFQFFLNLPSSDYTRIDHDNRYVMGGFLAGDAIRNAGHMFGSWYQMSNLPLKISALYASVTSNPYIMWGPWLINNPYYDNSENRFSYRTLYPKEFTHLVSETILNNLRFAANGRDDTTTIGKTVLFAGMLLPLARDTSNDSARLPGEFNDILNQQTQFNYNIVAVGIEPATPDPGDLADHYRKFHAKIFDFVDGKQTTASDVFMLPKGKVFVFAPGMFLFPLTTVKFYDGIKSYVLAYKVYFDLTPKDPLIQDSVKFALTEKYDEIANYCKKGFSGNGLEAYFNSTNSNFKGFKILQGIDTESEIEKLTSYYDSVSNSFEDYEKTNRQFIPAKFPISTMSRICEESVRGMGEISAAAALINGYWLGITQQNLEN